MWARRGCPRKSACQFVSVYHNYLTRSSWPKEGREVEHGATSPRADAQLKDDRHLMLAPSCKSSRIARRVVYRTGYYTVVGQNVRGLSRRYSKPPPHGPPHASNAG